MSVESLIRSQVGANRRIVRPLVSTVAHQRMAYPSLAIVPIPALVRRHRTMSGAEVICSTGASVKPWRIWLTLLVAAAVGTS
jgi:hypothetical protein